MHTVMEYTMDSIIILQKISVCKSGIEIFLGFHWEYKHIEIKKRMAPLLWMEAEPF